MSARKWNRKSSIFIPLQKHKLAAAHEKKKKCLLGKLAIQVEGWEIPLEPKTAEGQFDEAGLSTDVRPVASHGLAVEAPLYCCKLQPCLFPVLPPAPSATGPGRTPCLLVPLVTSPLTVDPK